MRLERPDQGRVKVVQTDAGVGIVIAARPNTLLTLFVGFWLVAWLMIEVIVLNQITDAVFGGGDARGAPLFLIAWLGAWTVGGVTALSVFFWNVAGVERILLSDGVLTVERAIPIWARKRHFAVSDISGWRTVPANVGGSSELGRNQVTGFLSDFRKGTIRFDCGRTMWAFGLDVDDAEARHIVDVLEAAS